MLWDYVSIMETLLCHNWRFWLPDLRLNCRRVYIKVKKQYHRAVCQKGKTPKAWKKTGDKGENELRKEIINK